MKGAISIWEIMDLPYSPGMGRIVAGMANALAAAENGAQAAFNKEQGGK